MTDTITEVAADLRSKLDTLNETVSSKVSDEALRALVTSVLEEMLKDEQNEVVRKLKFGGDTPASLQGTKYARLGLSIGDVEFLHDLQVSLTGQRKVDGTGFYQGPPEVLQGTFRAIQSGERVAPITGRQADEAALVGMLNAGRLSEGRFERAMRAMDTAESGFGSQLIGAQYVHELWRGARASARVFPLIRTFEMTDPTTYLPVEAGLPELLFVGESTANNSPNYDTVKTGSQRVQVDAKKFVIHQMWSGEMEEDSIIPFIPFLREQAARSLGHHTDSLVLNGDTTNAGTGNINLDDADPADTKHYLAFDGIRHAALVDNTANGKDVAGVITAEQFKTFRGRMLDTARKHDWGHPNDPNDLVHVADPETADAISFIDEFLTVDKYGPLATVLTGEQARCYGNPLISSIDVSKTEADGKVSTTGANNTKGQVVTFNRNGYVLGWRRRLQVETERLPATDQTRIVWSMRAGFGRFSPTGAASGIESAHVMYNISL